MLRNQFIATIVDTNQDAHKAVQSCHRGFYVTASGRVFNNRYPPAAEVIPIITDNKGRQSVLVLGVLVPLCQLVATTYIVRPTAKQFTLAHINNDLSDCSVANLEYISLDKNPLWSAVQSYIKRENP